MLCFTPELLTAGFCHLTDTNALYMCMSRVELSVPLSEVVKSEAPTVDVLAGSNLDEGTEFMSLCSPISCTANSSEFLFWCIDQFGPSLGPKVGHCVWLFQLSAILFSVYSLFDLQQCRSKWLILKRPSPVALSAFLFSMRSE